MEKRIKMLLSKDEVKDVLKQQSAQAFGMGDKYTVAEVSIRPSGKYIAEITLTESISTPKTEPQ